MKSKGIRLVWLFLVFILCIFFLIGCSSNTEQIEDDVSNHFVKYKDATVLVDVLIWEGILTQRFKIGFVSQKGLDEFEQGKANVIKLYHPYVEGEYTYINVATIKSINVYSYESFYQKYSPKKLESEYGIKVEKD